MRPCLLTKDKKSPSNASKQTTKIVVVVVVVVVVFITGLTIFVSVKKEQHEIANSL